MDAATRWVFVAQKFNMVTQQWTVKILPTDETPELYAEMDNDQVPRGVVEGDAFEVFTEPGKDPIVKFSEPEPFTAEQIADINTRAQNRYDRIRTLTD